MDFTHTFVFVKAMKIKSTVIFIFFISILNFSQSLSDTAKVLAVVDKYPITLDEFTARYEDYLIYSGVMDNIQLRYSILNNMINEILLHNCDDNYKILNNPEYIKEINWAKNETVLAFLKDREIYAKISVTDGELRDAFKKSKIKLKVRHLYAPTEEAANNLYDLLKIGVDFKELAKQTFTDSILRNNGGSLGYIYYGSTDPNFENAAYSLKVGEISKPIKTAQGYSIIKVEDRIENPLMTEYDFANMKNKLERGIKISKKIPYEKEYLKKIFGENKIEFNEKAVQNILTDLQNRSFNNLELENNKSSKSFCVLYRGNSYSQLEIEDKLNKTPKYNLEKLNTIEKIKSAIKGLLMQSKLLNIAEEKGYDSISYVKSTYQKIVNNIFLTYKRKEILEKIIIPDSDLFKYYNNNISFFTTEKEMNVQEIIVYDSTVVNYLKANLNENNFGEFARKYSLRKWSAENNGEMGLSPISNFGSLKDTLWNYDIGKITDPIKIEKYYGFFRVLKKQGGFPINFSIVKPQIIEAVKNEKAFSFIKKHINTLSEKVKIKVNQDLLKNFSLNLSNFELAGSNWEKL